MTDLTLLTEPAELGEAELAELETVVVQGEGVFMNVGLALMRIREGKGYKLRGFKTFEDYCERQFGITDRHGRRLIEATTTSQQIVSILGPGQAPRNAGVARELAKVAADPVVLGKVQAKLGTGRKPLSIATATAEKVAEVVAAVTGKTRPPKPEKGAPAPKPAAHAGAPAAAPTLQPDGIASLQATFISARSFLANHAWLKEDADAQRIVGQLDRGLVQLDTLLAAAYARPITRPGMAPSAKSEAGAPRCPNCKHPIKPGDIFCDKCGQAL